MRVNLPVSPQEYVFPKGQTLVSTTDLKGRILYCNPMFIEVRATKKKSFWASPTTSCATPTCPRRLTVTCETPLPAASPGRHRSRTGARTAPSTG